ncbi:MAG TPA: undecaprenyldiphospho-muramoylpentapeptide beta-N-acetylglucosaminyltransferase [Fulvivirga sp.]|nr:undecaprenyldiphospho-muramoylpentapeptide beta-N-acetylglucosaminyltransferase [Fulvivirga sp.]
MTRKEPYRFIISGGGTGGHIYPALAVANEIKRIDADAQILFVGAMGKMEMTMVPKAGYEIVGLWISGIQRRVTISNLIFPFKVIYSFISAMRIVKKYKPDAVLGFGGYVSGPMMFAANKYNVPSLIQEQNSYAGLTNKKFGKKAGVICVAYNGMEKYFPANKIVLTGNPVRRDILDIEKKKSEGLAYFNLDSKRKTILILGGSLGARTINDSIIGKLDQAIKAGHQVLWQTGRFYFDEMTSKSKNFDLTNVRVVQFIDRMDLAYAVADVIVSRAGALSISEMCIVGKPVILVPSPNVAEDHQTKNAEALSTVDAAILIKDSAARLTLMLNIIDLLENAEVQNKLSKNIKKLARPSAAKDIVEELMKIVK